MELIIAILWYLQIVFTNNIYTDTEVNQMINANQTAIDDILSDEELSQQIYTNFNDENEFIDQPDWIEIWDNTNQDPIPE